MKKYLHPLLNAVAAVLGLVGIFLGFAAGYVYTINSSILGSRSLSISVFQLAFGTEETDPVVGLIFWFIFLVLGVLAALAAAYLAFAKKGPKICLSGTAILGMLFFLVAGILVFCTVAFVGSGAVNADVFGSAKGSLGVGSIISGICCILAAVVLAPSAIVAFKK